MNICLLGTTDIIGGASRAAYRLHCGLRLMNHQSFMVVKEKYSKDSNVFYVSPHSDEYHAEYAIFDFMQRREIDNNRTDLSTTRFSIPYPGYDLSNNVLILESDLINLHWLDNFQSTETVSALLKLGKPVIWTLHDENPFTGGCHYTSGCTRFLEDCMDCPQLLDSTYQIPARVLQNKLCHFQDNLTIVTPSKWLAKRARESRVFRHCRVEVIPNSIETDIFTPTPKTLAKEELQLDPEGITLLFGAEIQRNRRKGFSKLLEAIHSFRKHDKFKELIRQNKIHFITFGASNQKLPDIGMPVTAFGYVCDDARLALIYSAADIYLLTSLEDNLPNNLLEAMACGTPVVSFAVGGMPDVIENGVTGYVAPCFDTEAYGKLILELVFDPEKRNQMSLNCRRLIEKEFQLRHQATRYLDLFEDLLKDTSNRRTKNAQSVAQTAGNQIVLNQWQSGIAAEFYDIYRKAAVGVIERRDSQLAAFYNSKVIRLLRILNFIKTNVFLQRFKK